MASDNGARQTPILPTTENTSFPSTQPIQATPSAKISKSKQEPWWIIHPFRGMIKDLRRRAPYYLSDWTDAWNYRVVPATVYMYFAKLVTIRHLILCPDSID